MAKFFSNFASDGHILGQTLSDKIGFWGVTAIVQPSASGQAAVTATVTTATPTITAFGFTSAQAADIITSVNAQRVLLDAIRTALVNSGIMKGSA
jgi:hypothetical protein